MTRRRRFLRAVGTALTTAAVAGCARDSASGPEGGSQTPEADFVAGPDNELAFAPETLTVSTGEAVTWRFESADHNVVCDSAQAERTRLPEGADPFRSSDGDDEYAVNDVGAAFSHTFSTPGTYVCVPHASNGMVGEIRVEE